MSTVPRMTVVRPNAFTSKKDPSLHGLEALPIRCGNRGYSDEQVKRYRLLFTHSSVDSMR